MLSGRRSFLTSAWFTRWLSITAASTAVAAKPARGVYDELGIRPILNFRGTHTTIGASKQWPELHAAMEEAARSFVSLDELQDKVGERLSRLIGTESAIVTTGTAGSITVGTCACIAGSDPQAIRQIPDTSGLKNEVLCLKLHRNSYDHAVRTAGALIVDIENPQRLAEAITPRTAMMYWLGGTSGDYVWPQTISLEDVLKITKPAGVPVLVDAANMLPPFDNLRKLAATGVDLICVSGGKHMRGPQCSGILAGRKDLVAAARLNMSPHSDSLGRPMKVGREEMIGLLLAAEKYSKLDFEALDKECLRQAEYLRDAVAKLPGVKTKMEPFDRTRKVRRLVLQWDEKSLGLTAAEVEQKLWDGNPRIAVQRYSPQGLMLTCFMNDLGDEKPAAKRLVEVLRKA
ncbi:MAG: aminotransferase class V-fold PLP-dependent enzyme [Bryobacterales bacterium]|nr:aminotransferase class V-fold PLP-dependent enzyme [Bryobacterales bacterium]